MDPLVERVQGALSALCRAPDQRSWGDSGWTRRVKEAIVALAREDSQLAYASGAEGAAGGEWLYDLTWLDYSPETRLLKRTVLVLESEWDRDQKGIEEDFHKLLVARADLRVMVFQSWTCSCVRRIASDLVRIVQNCTQSAPGDRYLLAGWHDDVREFEYRLYEHGAG